MNHVSIFIQNSDAALTDLLIAELSQIGFDGFEEVEEGLKAFCVEDAFNEAEIICILAKNGLVFTKEIIAAQNWNKVWESNFNPMQVDNFVGVRASFHQPMQGVQHEIIITPKMSFGTGHHATTYMMMQLMQAIDFKNKAVLDFGSGTGILAILAEKLGSHRLLAIDYDDWCIENATENIAANNCKNIILQKADTADLTNKFDIVIANINKNIILDNLQYLAKDVAINGQILLSGLLIEDEAEIIEATEKLGWVNEKTITKDMWIALQFSTKSTIL